MSHAHGHHGVRRCHHCGGEVAETVHTRTTYRVGYYSLHTGDVEPVELIREDDPSTVVTVLRLIRPYDVFTCTRCFGDPAVRGERERLFRPELDVAAEPTGRGRGSSGQGSA
jgi:hypothetical protein